MLGLSDDTARLARARLFHYCMKQVLAPLKSLGTTGKRMVGGDGAIRQCHPLIACYVTDYPEQSLVCCMRAGSTRKKEFGANFCYETRSQSDTLRTIKHAYQQSNTSCREVVLKDAGLTAVPEPFWAPDHVALFKNNPKVLIGQITKRAERVRSCFENGFFGK